VPPTPTFTELPTDTPTVTDTPTPELAVMPQLIGQHPSVVEDLLARNEITVYELVSTSDNVACLRAVENNAIKDGHVCATDPQAGTSFDPTQTTVLVYLWEPVRTSNPTMPNLVGAQLKDALAVLREIGIEPVVQETAFSSDSTARIPCSVANEVLQTDPQAGKEINASSTRVVLTVCTPRQPAPTATPTSETGR
jgi:beta-lactam-binding protein with PASTA domain